MNACLRRLKRRQAQRHFADRRCKAAHWHSPNHNARPPQTIVDTVVVHNIALPPGDCSPRWIRAFFLNRLPADQHPYFVPIAKVRVSAHFYISRRGRVVSCVPVHRRAWHAGVSQMMTPQGVRENINHSSVGIELAGSDELAYTSAQYQALRRVLLGLARQYPIQYVVGHCDIAPNRKTDPGPLFDWAACQRSLPPSVAQRIRFRT